MRLLHRWAAAGIFCRVDYEREAKKITIMKRPPNIKRRDFLERVSDLTERNSEPLFPQGKSVLWWIFLAPGKVLLWFDFMYPETMSGAIGSGRRRRVPLSQFVATLAFYILLLIWAAIAFF